mgnify:FL=1|jgi:hypothetical protein|tara:strand:- start:215 stop:364 length:150 start_codon:yes stop_codon:yes gene_type:complete
MASKVYLVMNDLGVVAVYGLKEKAEAKAAAIQEKYAMNHWIETKEITVD